MKWYVSGSMTKIVDLVNLSGTQNCLCVRIHSQEGIDTIREVGDVTVLGQLVGNVFSCLNASQLDKTVTRGAKGLGEQLSGLGVTLSADDGSHLLLFRLFDEEAGTLGFLLGDLLGLDGGSKFRSEGDLGLDETKYVGLS